MSEKKDYEKDFSKINKWAGRWAEFYSAKTRYEELTCRVRQEVSDGFAFWEHYCKVQKDIMGFEKGTPCDWCGATEQAVQQKTPAE